MLQKLLIFLFPKTINKIKSEACIIKEYGSIEQFNKLMEYSEKALSKRFFEREQEKKEKRFEQAWTKHLF